MMRECPHEPKEVLLLEGHIQAALEGVVVLEHGSDAAERLMWHGSAEVVDRPSSRAIRSPYCRFTYERCSPRTLIPQWEQEYITVMRIIAKRTLRQFWETHPRGAKAKTRLEVWHSAVEAADWATPADVRATYGDASILKNSRVVFNIAGNQFRLVTRINYPYRVVYVRFVGTHEEYDDIDAETI
jgi:mRNA interferase HigB